MQITCSFCKHFYDVPVCNTVAGKVISMCVLLLYVYLIVVKCLGAFQVIFLVSITKVSNLFTDNFRAMTVIFKLEARWDL